jgi:5-methylcytosine-specific restriction protein A
MRRIKPNYKPSCKPVNLAARNSFDKERYGKGWEEVKAQVPLAGRSCERCGSTTKLERDHIVNISKGGRNSVSNVQILCERCHDIKHPHRVKNRNKKK